MTTHSETRSGAMTGSPYRTEQVPVRGGMLTVAVWGPDDAETVVAIHGITATHRAWAELAASAPDLRIIAPDLRGRGRSNTLPGPWGMATHAEDTRAVLDHFSLARATLISHSMGAFVAATLAIRHPERVAGLVLVDGGLPLPYPAGVAPADLPEAIIGAAARRLGMTFVSVESYREFWRAHPAFRDEWSGSVEQYVDYDLDGEAPNLRPSGDIRAVTEDSLQLNGNSGYASSLATLPMPVHFIRAPRDLVDVAPGLYPPAEVEEWAKRMPGIRFHESRDVNHYTIVMGAGGVDQVLPVLRELIQERT